MMSMLFAIARSFFLAFLVAPAISTAQIVASPIVILPSPPPYGVEVYDLTPIELSYAAPPARQTLSVEVKTRTLSLSPWITIDGLSPIPMEQDPTKPGKFSVTLPLPPCLGNVAFVINLGRPRPPRPKFAPEMGAFVHAVQQRPPYCQGVPAYPQLFTVNATEDFVDSNPGDGFCSNKSQPSNANCSLRAALMEANAWSNRDLIRLPAGRYTLSLKAENGETPDGTDASEGDLDIIHDVAIVGFGTAQQVTGFLRWPGSGSADRLRDDPTKDAAFAKIDGGGIDRVFQVAPEASALIERVAILNGDASRGDPFLNGFQGGGGILNDGELRLDHVALVENHAASKTGAAFGGGAVENRGKLLAEDSLFARNMVDGFNPAGGAIFNGDGASTVVRRSLIYANGARFGCVLRNVSTGAVRLENVLIDSNAGSAAAECAYLLNNDGSGVVDLSFVTISRNKGDLGGVPGSLLTSVAPGVVAIRASLIVGNTAFSGCWGLIASGGGNVFDGTCMFTTRSAILDVLNASNLQVAGGIEDRGGFTPVLAFRRPTTPGTSLLDLAERAGVQPSPLTDQRGPSFPRPRTRSGAPGGLPDPGSFEFSP